MYVFFYCFPVLQREDSQLETDLDARLVPKHRMVTSSPRIRQRDAESHEGPQPAPHSAPPINPVAPMVYKPNVNLEDAVKWPIDLPGKLDFKKMEVFEGKCCFFRVDHNVSLSSCMLLQKSNQNSLVNSFMRDKPFDVLTMSVRISELADNQGLPWT